MLPRITALHLSSFVAHRCIMLFPHFLSMKLVFKVLKQIGAAREVCLLRCTNPCMGMAEDVRLSNFRMLTLLQMKKVRVDQSMNKGLTTPVVANHYFPMHTCQLLRPSGLGGALSLSQGSPILLLHGLKGAWPPPYSCRCHPFHSRHAFPGFGWPICWSRQYFCGRP